jgi:hypothetical protein
MSWLCLSLTLVQNRHSEYSNQYRAIETVNTKIKYDKALLYDVPEGEPRQGIENTRCVFCYLSNDVFVIGEQERYCPVSCGTCGYECGVYGPDEEDTYHFFDVLIGVPVSGSISNDGNRGDL